MTGIAEAVQTTTELRKPLTALVNKGCVPVGGIFRLDYDSAVVLTDDFKKHEAGSVPRGGFLLAVAGENTSSGFVLEDQEVILLRVRGTAPLPNESELIQTRLAVVRDAGASGVGFDDVTDVLTRNELQQSAFDCEVLGTFYTETDARDAQIEYGADIDNVVVSARYQVFLPSTEVLSWLASYPEPADQRDALAIGKVRFAATRRKALIAGTDQAEVRIDVSDFVGRKTAVFGMTRTGKSNTIKTLVTAVHRYGSEHRRPIGQLIFDPQGEYANVNQQDRTGLRLLGDDDSMVRIYKVEPSAADSREKPLRINFYDREVLDAAWSLVSEATAPVNTNYGRDFRSSVLSEPDQTDRSAHSRWGWAMVAFYGLLAKCGFQGGSLPQNLVIAAPSGPMNAFMDAHPGAAAQAGRVEADNIRSREVHLVATADQLESAEQIGQLCQSAFDLGVAVWTLGQSRQITTDLSVQVDRFRAEVASAAATAVTAIGEQVAIVAEPGTGVLASAVEREVAGLKKAVAEAFDANDKSSALSRIEESVSSVAAASKAQTVEAVRQVLNPSGGAGPLADLRETIVREVSIPLEQVTATVAQLKEMAAADEARRAERAFGTAQGADYESRVAQLLAEMGQSSGDVVIDTGAQTGALGTAKVGDHVSEIATGDGSTVRVVFESKKRKRMTMQKIRDELDAAAKNRDASIAVMVLSSDDSAPNRMPFQRVGAGRYTVVYSEDTGDALALRVAYHQARVEALTQHRADRSGQEQQVDLEALLALIGEARNLLDETTRLGAGIRKAQSSLDATLKLGEKLRADIMDILDKCQVLVSASAGV